MAYYVDPEQTCSSVILMHFCPNIYAFYSIAVMQLFSLAMMIYFSTYGRYTERKKKRRVNFIPKFHSLKMVTSGVPIHHNNTIRNLILGTF